MTDIPRLRKRPLEAEAAASGRAANEIDIVGRATISYSSEDPAQPVEHLLDGQSGPGATRWMSARVDTIEHIVLEFDRPQTISRLVYEVKEATRERTQEVRVEVSEDGARTYRQILVQEYNFSPRGATYQREEQRLDLDRVTHLRLAIVPNKNGSGTKGEKVRLVFLSSRAKTAVQQYLGKRTDIDEALFIQHGRPVPMNQENDLRLSPRSVERIIKHYAAAAGIAKKVSPHTLRHSFATDPSGAGPISVQCRCSLAMPISRQLRSTRTSPTST